MLSTAAFAGTNTTTLGLRISSETGPVGDMVQVKIFTTSPQSIASGTLALTFDGSTVDNPPVIFAEVFSATGDVTGVAYPSELNGYVVIFQSPSGGVGRLPDLPLAQFTIIVDKAHTVGINIPASNFSDIAGNAFTLDPNAIQPGSIAVGGTLTFDDPYPGGGVIPAGVPIKFSGSGFTPNTTVSIAGASISGTSFFSSGEILVTLASPTELTNKHIVIQNPNGEHVDYWSWLHGNSIGQFIGAPIFPSSFSTTAASCNPQAFPADSLYLAIQNPSTTPINVTVTNLEFGMSDQATTTVNIESSADSGVVGATAVVPIEHDITSSAPFQIWCVVTGPNSSLANLTLTPIQYNAQPPPAMSLIVNGASLTQGAISPGEIVTIFGSGFGTSGISVLFDNQAAPVIYQSDSQVDAIVPYEVAAESITTIQVESNSTMSAAWGVPVTNSAPGIFTLGSSGQGQAAAVNQDGTINGPLHPAPLGSIISLYATGEGQTSPAGVDGKPAQTPLPQPLLPVTVNIGGQSVIPLYAGGAPGEVAGLLQVNALIPSSVQPGNAVPVILQVGDNSSETVTIAVRGN